MDKVRVFFYTHHPTVSLDEFPADWTKERLNNVGRESFAYVTWLTENLAPEKVHLLSDFVWFSQAAPEGDGWNQRSGLMKRVRLLSPRTGMLGLGLMESANCENGGSFTQTPWVHSAFPLPFSNSLILTPPNFQCATCTCWRRTSCARATGPPS